MNKTCFALAAIAALGLTDIAFAEDAAKGKTTAPSTMSDSELDGVTAAGASVTTPGPNVDVILPFQAGRGGGWVNGKGNENSHNGNAANLSTGGG